MFYYGAQADQRTGAFIESEASAAICFTKDISEGITSMYSRRRRNSRVSSFFKLKYLKDNN